MRITHMWNRDTDDFSYMKETTIRYAKCPAVIYTGYVDI